MITASQIQTTGEKITIGLSGGVDSAVAAILLQQQGYQVSAIFMKNWDEDDDADYCPAEQDLADARAVCDKLGIPLKTVNFSKQYWQQVFRYFLRDYEKGLTPNPDILCNREIKFQVFLDFALSDHPGAFAARYIATGHYARIKKQDEQYFLLKGKDPNKDQSYFLYTLGQKPLSKAMFPLGELEKSQVRALARQYQLPVYHKKDSTGICFIGERNFSEFLSRFLHSEPGDMVDEAGRIIGRHKGLIHYTLGQRKGLGIGGRRNSSGAPWFVAAKRLRSNQLLVVQGKDHPLLYQQQVQADQLHWVSGKVPDLPLQCRAKTRYRQPDQDCQINTIKHGIAQICFDQPQFAVTPGQSVVFYQDDICLGGGIIRA